LADAVCGAVFGALSHTPRNSNQEVEIHTFRDRKDKPAVELPKNTIVFEQKTVEDAKDYLTQFNML
jgi:hypothetical protein